MGLPWNARYEKSTPKWELGLIDLLVLRTTLHEGTSAELLFLLHALNICVYLLITDTEVCSMFLP
jgi:hypothetical protein